MKVCVLGFGVEGQSSVDHFLKQGASIHVYDAKTQDTFDQLKINQYIKKGVGFEFGGSLKSFDFDLFIRSPGIPLNSSLIKSINKKNKAISSTIKLFFDSCPCPIIGVTGTKGKGTTSKLIFEILKEEGKNIFLGGNIGNPPLDFLDKLNKNSIVVLELSSFQLEDLDKSPHIAVVLMVTEDKLEIHKNIKKYINAKKQIVKFQNGLNFVIANADYPSTLEIIKEAKSEVFFVSNNNPQRMGCFIEDGWVVINWDEEQEKIINIQEIFLPGKHNLENVCSAVMATKILKVANKNIVKVLKEFKGLPHRLELVREFDGIKFYDDSFATNPDPTIAAIKAFNEPKILILGGSSKNSDFSKLGKIISEDKTIKAIIGIGAEWPRIKASIKSQALRTKFIENCKNMREIIKKASETAKPGDIVILSPACASFDMFKNYKERGDQFKNYVKEL